MIAKQSTASPIDTVPLNPPLFHLTIGLTPRADRYSFAAVALCEWTVSCVPSRDGSTHEALDEFVYTLVMIAETSGGVGVRTLCRARLRTTITSWKSR